MSLFSLSQMPNDNSPVKMELHSSRLTHIHIILILGVLLVIAMGAFTVKRSADAERASREAGKKHTEQLLHTMSDHARLTFIAADTTLRRAVEKDYFNTLFGNTLNADAEHNLQQWVEETPHVSGMLLADGEGNITAIARDKQHIHWMEYLENIADQDYFDAHKISDDSELLYVGLESRGVVERPDFVILSRRLNRLDGTFGGIALVAVNTDYILELFRAVEDAKLSGIYLFRDVSMWESNLLLFNYSGEKGGFSFSQGDMVASAVVEQRKDDETFRLIAFTALPDLRLLLGVSTHSDDILAPWRSQYRGDWLLFAMLTLFVLAVSFLALAISRQAERARRSEKAAVMASQAKSDFLAHMSHELRTPLNAIIGFSDMISEGYFGKLNKKQEERIKDINACGKHLLELINDVLELSKGIAGKITLHREEVSLPEVIEEVLGTFRDQTKTGRRKIINHCRNQVPMLKADRRKIKQILLNLVSNAVRFTDENGTVEVACESDDQRNFVITVKDNGIGMREEDIPKALKAFEQASNDPARGGTGLGLPLCKMFVELHGGSLRIKSARNVGTKVSVILPAKLLISGKNSRNDAEKTMTGA